jgi:hypothetical protein
MRPFSLLLFPGAALLAAAPTEAHVTKACWLYKAGGFIDFWLYTYAPGHRADTAVGNKLVYNGIAYDLDNPNPPKILTTGPDDIPGVGSYDGCLDFDPVECAYDPVAWVRGSALKPRRPSCLAHARKQPFPSHPLPHHHVCALPQVFKVSDVPSIPSGTCGTTSVPLEISGGGATLSQQDVGSSRA